MKNLRVAFYLIGHGPRREPRLVELQHKRILRHRSLACLPYEDDSISPQVFIDLNHDRRDPTRRLQDLFPQLDALISTIASGVIGLVYLDIEEVQSPSVNYSWVEMYLKEAGAEVINIFYDEDKVFEESLKERYGTDALKDHVDDASDFVCFFPRSAFRIAMRSLGGFPAGLSDNIPEKSLNLLRHLMDLNPYAAGNTPFVEQSLERIWEQMARQRKTADPKP
jgi:hypothetical protein